jgi:hypothetical protein
LGSSSANWQDSLRKVSNVKKELFYQMDFKIGETLKFEEIWVKVVKIKEDAIVFEVLPTGHEEDEGKLMEVPMWYIQSNKDQVKR